jgi:peptidoglycan-N-acetylglucosamine deacetylase
MTPHVPPTQRAAVNVDIDGLYLYDRIHGYQGGSGNAADFDPATANPVMWTRGVTRFLDLFDRTKVKATFFVVAQDLAHPDAQAVLREVLAAGHEVGNHSLTHPYDLSRRDRLAIGDELSAAKRRLEDFCGTDVKGFRAPGYVLSDDLREAIVDTGHVYSSSRFPCPPYQAAKAAVIGAYTVLGRPSGSIAEGPGVWFSDPQPTVERLPSGRALLELPIGVVRGIRMPFIGTSLIALGRLGQALLQPFVDRTPWLNFECHAIDLTDHVKDQIPARLAVQPDQRVPLSRKWPLFIRALEQLRTTHDVTTLAGWCSRGV